MCESSLSCGLLDRRQYEAKAAVVRPITQPCTWLRKNELKQSLIMTCTINTKRLICAAR